ncbi:MAG: hypothetical protein DRG24_07040 [Epsilonproteobacteria bacterium]|nr:MAG: hypothetical protein DRG24_07040 [Campylobacterota bacterium]
MSLSFKLKHYLTSSFRELFLYHHSSLEFRAKLFATIIAANEEAKECEYDRVQEAGMKIYSDEDRAMTLRLTTEEFVNKVHYDNGIAIDELVEDIVKNLKAVPRYAQKIDLSVLEPLIQCHEDEDTQTYQTRMLEFFERLKDEYAKKST